MIILMEEISWRQKSRALWLQAGDRYTKKFHKIANMHRKFNSLSSIEVERVCFDTLPAMKSAIFGFYKSLFTESKPWRPFVDGVPLPLLQTCNLLVRSLLRSPSVRRKFLKLFFIVVGISLPIQME